MASEVTPTPSPPPAMLRRARRRRVRNVAALALTVSLVAFSGAAGVRALSRPAKGVPAESEPCAWHIVPSPNVDPSTYANALRKVAVIAAGDAWAIGTFYVNQEGGEQRTSLLHWDGKEWGVASQLANSDAGLLDIAAVSPS